MLFGYALIFLRFCILKATADVDSEYKMSGANGSSLSSLHRVKRVVGGYPSDIRHQPYVVNIRKRRIFVCGGSLLTPKFVLTAAHCVKNAQLRDLLVRGGVTYLSEARNNRSVRDVHFPPSYNSNSLDNDLAMLQLHRELRGPEIGSIELAWEAPKAGTIVQVTGWGLTSANALEPSNQMRSVNVRVMEQAKCRNLYQGYRDITTAMFCATGPGLKDACSADSGGPAVAKGRLVGVVSWGKRNKCADDRAPGVYVNVAAMRHWVTQILQKYDCKIKPITGTT